MWQVGDCGMRVVGKMSKDIGMGVRKGAVVSFVTTLFSCFLGIPFLYVLLLLKTLENDRYGPQKLMSKSRGEF